MALYAYDPGTGIFTHAFDGGDLVFLEDCARANGCSAWVMLDTPPDFRTQRWDGAGVVPRTDAPGPEALRAQMQISPRQLFIALASPPWSLITPAEAVAAATTGAMPASVDAVIATLPVLEAMQARVTWARMQEVRRADPLVDLIAAARPDMTAEAIDEFFTFAAGL